MTRSRATRSLVRGALLVTSLFLLSRCSSPAETPSGPAATIPSTTEPAAHETEEKKPEVWTCAMHPHIRLPKPGKCPICGMTLIPVEDENETAEEGDMPNLRRLVMSPAAAALANIQTTPVTRAAVSKEVRMVGKIDYDETRIRKIAAWVPGRIDKLFVDFTGVRVNEGEHLVYVYSPDLRTAQEELLQAKEATVAVKKSNVSVLAQYTTATIEAARDKLHLLGLTREQITETERSGKPSDHLTIFSPIGGTVVKKHAFEGMYVDTGTPIYEIADLSKLWVQLDAYESDISWIRYGQDVAFSTEAYAGETFHGRVAFIEPTLNPRTRTVKIRVNVDNSDGRLKPEMFVRAVVRAEVTESGVVMDPALVGKWIGPMHPEIVRDKPETCPICGMALVPAEEYGYIAHEEDITPLLIPASAPLITGERAVVYVKVPDPEKPTFEGREIVLGQRTGDRYIVRAGLQEGEEVVVKGNFKVDASLQIKARPSMMSAEGAGGGSGHTDEARTGSLAPAQKSSTPEAFRRALRSLFEARERIATAVHQADLPAARQAFAALGRIALDVPMSNLEVHAHMQWMELRQQLSVSATLGEQAETVEEAKELLPTLRRELTNVRHTLDQLDSPRETHIERSH